MSVRQIHDGSLGASATGIVARPVAKVVATVDQWDVMLIVGVISLVVGAWLQWGAPVGLIAGGALLVVGGLYGARGSNVMSEVDTS